MAYEIIVRKRFTNKVVRLLAYLETVWGKNVAEQFSRNMELRIENLATRPFSGIQTNIQNCRSILITKHNRVYYRVKNDSIEILNIYDTRINPATNPYK